MREMFPPCTRSFFFTAERASAAFALSRFCSPVVRPKTVLKEKMRVPLSEDIITKSDLEPQRRRTGKGIKITNIIDRRGGEELGMNFMCAGVTLERIHPMAVRTS
jgi:hypothetical protein